jgi:hypothetical protein
MLKAEQEQIECPKGNRKENLFLEHLPAIYEQFREGICMH